MYGLARRTPGTCLNLAAANQLHESPSPWQDSNNVTILVKDATLAMQHFPESEVRNALERFARTLDDAWRIPQREDLIVCLK